jgi:hypothetical protein
MSSQLRAPVRTFLAVYDYGQGGVWLLLDAPSIEVARTRFPGITVFDERPVWMSDEQEIQFRSRCAASGFRWDVRAQPTGWLLEFEARTSAR